MFGLTECRFAYDANGTMYRIGSSIADLMAHPWIPRVESEWHNPVVMLSSWNLIRLYERRLGKLSSIFYKERIYVHCHKCDVA